MSRLEGPFPEGGHQSSKEYEDATVRLLSQRESARCMFPGEFLKILQENLHPRLNTIGIAVSERMQQIRKQQKIGRCGTIWVASPKVMQVLFVVPADCLPFTSIRRLNFNEEKCQNEAGTHLAKGWRKSLADLVKEGVLKHSPCLSYLIGEDSFQIQKRKFRI